MSGELAEHVQVDSKAIAAGSAVNPLTWEAESGGDLDTRGVVPVRIHSIQLHVTGTITSADYVSLYYSPASGTDVLLQKTLITGANDYVWRPLAPFNVAVGDEFLVSIGNTQDLKMELFVNYSIPRR